MQQSGQITCPTRVRWSRSDDQIAALYGEALRMQKLWIVNLRVTGQHLSAEAPEDLAGALLAVLREGGLGKGAFPANALQRDGTDAAKEPVAGLRHNFGYFFLISGYIRGFLSQTRS